MRVAFIMLRNIWKAKQIKTNTKLRIINSNVNVSNTTLWKMIKQLSIENETKEIRWWIGHTLRKPPETTTRQDTTCNPPGKKRRGRPRNTWQRDKRHRKRNKRDGIHDESNGEDGHGQKTVAFLGRWPMLPA